MLSAVIPAERSQPAVHLAVQLAHQRFVRPGPLVLGTALLKSLTRAADRDRSVSRRSKPSFRSCSTRRSHSQAPLCTCTPHLIANQAEGTFGRLRYILGGNRPS